MVFSISTFLLKTLALQQSAFLFVFSQNVGYQIRTNYCGIKDKKQNATNSEIKKSRLMNAGKPLVSLMTDSLCK